MNEFICDTEIYIYGSLTQMELETKEVPSLTYDNEMSIALS